jgi:hypothetical protein
MYGHLFYTTTGCIKSSGTVPYVERFGWFMVFNATFNNISVISWRSVLLVEETGVPGDNHRPVASH